MAWPVQAENAPTPNLPVQFPVSSSYGNDVKVYITLQSSVTPFDVYYKDSHEKLMKFEFPKVSKSDPVPALTKSVLLSDIKDATIYVNRLTSGVVYASLDLPLCDPDAKPKVNEKGTAPSASNPSDFAYYYPWQAIAEITYNDDQGDSGDITAINAFSIPATIEVYTGNTLAEEAGFSQADSKIIEDIAKLSTSAKVTVPKGPPLPNNPSDNPYRGKVIRVISPAQFGYTQNPSTQKYYYSIGGFSPFQPYAASVEAEQSPAPKGSGLPKGVPMGATHITGVTAGKYLAPYAPPFSAAATYAADQTPWSFSYDFYSWVEKGSIITRGSYTANSGSNTTQGVGNTYTVTIAKDSGSNYNLSSAIYLCPTLANYAGTSAPPIPTGAAPPFTENTGVDVTSDNAKSSDAIHPAALAQVLHDVCAGYNFGFVHSKTRDKVTHQLYGTEDSATWFADATVNDLYDKLQPDTSKGFFYNQFAQIISNSSDGTIYGFAYADAVGEGVVLNTVLADNGMDVTRWVVQIGPKPIGSEEFKLDELP